MNAVRRIPRAVWMLGAVSLFMDMSSELVHAVLPVYLTTVLGLSVITVGIIEGIAEATASITKVASGYLSDRFSRRKPLVLLGYAMSALTKPMFPLSTSAIGIVTARFLDRIGKGVRGAPRDALIADVTPADSLDAAYGLRQALDTAGAIVGPMLAMLFVWLWANDLRAVLWAATVPAIVAVVLLALGVQEPDTTHAGESDATLPRLHPRALPAPFWRLVAVAALFALARLSEAFLVLRAQQLQLALVWIPLVMIVMSTVYTLSAYPAGLLAARFGRTRLLGASLVALIAAQLALGWLPGTSGLWIGVALWGLHMGLSQGGLSAAVADVAPATMRASAFGVFHLVTGVFQLASGVLAGWLWQHYGSAAAFSAGAFCAALAFAATATGAGVARPARLQPPARSQRP